MEMLIALLLLFLSERNAELKETLKSVLDFYRENRELITLLVNETSSLSTPSAPAPQPEPSEKKNSPASGGDNLKILEEFLRNRKA